MVWLHEFHHRSRFGQLLVKRGLITQEQLDRAIAHQEETGRRIGEILTEWDVLTHQHLDELLHSQYNMRAAAAIAVALLSPLAAFAAPAMPQLASNPPAAAMQQLSESEMRGSAAQGLSADLVAQISQPASVNGVAVIGDMTKLVNPVLGFLEAESSAKNVVYDARNASAVVQADGSLTLQLPTSIGALSFNNVHVRGNSGGNFGSVEVRGIDLSSTVVSLGVRH
ncbi:hypothetical protein [Duganella fentianensis]|uniref:hypothetical protein n=1 Tax=Duganella fentianensis TaxID=2692177 RepID=UPI0032B1B66D